MRFVQQVIINNFKCVLNLCVHLLSLWHNQSWENMWEDPLASCLLTSVNISGHREIIGEGERIKSHGFPNQHGLGDISYRVTQRHRVVGVKHVGHSPWCRLKVDTESVPRTETNAILRQFTLDVDLEQRTKCSRLLDSLFEQPWRHADGCNRQWYE